MTLRMGSWTTRTFGLLFTRQPFSVSHSAPSRKRPEMKQPAWNHTIISFTRTRRWSRVHHYRSLVCRWFHPRCCTGSPACTVWKDPEANRFSCKPLGPVQSGRILGYAALTATWLLALRYPPTGHMFHFISSSRRPHNIQGMKGSSMIEGEQPHPIAVLLVPPLEMAHPVTERLQRVRCQLFPNGRNLTVHKWSRNLVQLTAHPNLTSEGLGKRTH